MDDIEARYAPDSKDSVNASTSSIAAVSSNQSSGNRVKVLAMCALIAPWLAAWWLPPFAQPQWFHDYADQRVWLGLPHAADVLSNLPFLVVGALGLQFVLHGWHRRNPDAFSSQRAAWPYALLFFGVLLTAFGSAWYHTRPSDATLVWDRLPMALGFAGLVAGTLSDRAPSWAGARLPLIFAAVGTVSVLYWHIDGNLVPYLVMQVGFVATALIATPWLPSEYTHAYRLYIAAGLYAIAVVFERLDHQTYAWLAGTISGHTIKHLFACAAIFVVLSMLKVRLQRVLQEHQ